MTQQVILQAENAGKVYDGQGRAVTAVDGVRLSVQKEDFLVIMGASGSGKSTLLFLLSALESCDSGRILYQGQRIDNAKAAELAALRRNAFGFVFQGIHLVPYLSLQENVRIAALTAGMADTEAEERVGELMDRFDLQEARNGLPSRVSGGEAQRAAVARAIINQPDILFADEPIGSLNYASGTAVLETFSQLNSQGQTIVMVSHDLNAACYGRRIVFMRDGKLLDQLDFSESKTEPPSFDEKRKTLIAWLEERGW